MTSGEGKYTTTHWCFGNIIQIHQNQMDFMSIQINVASLELAKTIHVYKLHDE